MLLALLLGSAVAGPPKMVMEVSEFDIIESDKSVQWMVKFFDPKCYHCQQLAPILDELAVENVDSSFRMAKVDCTVEKALCSQWDVSSLPAVLFMHEGLSWRFNGGRSKEVLQHAIDRMKQPSLEELEWPHGLQGDGQRVLYLYGRGDGEASEQVEKSFGVVARYRHPNVTRFAATSSVEVLGAALGVGAADVPRPVIVKVEAGEAPLAISGKQLDEASSVSALDAWLGHHRFPRFPILAPTGGSDAEDLYFELLVDGRLLALAVAPPPSCRASPSCDANLTAADAGEGLASLLRDVAREPGDLAEMHFGMLDGALWTSWADNHHVTAQSMPQLVVMDGLQKIFYTDEKGAVTNAASLRAFLKDAQTGQLRCSHEGFFGIPGRVWRTAVRAAPALSHLDFLPNWSLFTSLVLTWAVICVYLLFLQSDGELVTSSDFKAGKAD